MNKKFIAVICCLIMVISALTGCGTQSKSETASANKKQGEEVKEYLNKMDTEPEDTVKTVIATTFAVYDWAKNIVGDSTGIEVKYLVDNAVDLHSYQPSASDIIAYNDADLILCIGGESEKWIGKLNVNPDNIVTLIDSVEPLEEEEGEEERHSKMAEAEEESEYDEHIWLSLKNAERCINTINYFFQTIDPDNSETYQKNADSYKEALQTLHKDFYQFMKNRESRTLVFGDRFPFRYLAEDYRLNCYAAFSGCSAETEASFETITSLAEKMNDYNLDFICVIGTNYDIANAIIEASSRPNVEIVEFNSMQSISNKEADSMSYLDIMTQNFEILKRVLGE